LDKWWIDWLDEMFGWLGRTSYGLVNAIVVDRILMLELLEMLIEAWLDSVGALV
jgi:hypothetical protein